MLITIKPSHCLSLGSPEDYLLSYTLGSKQWMGNIGQPSANTKAVHL